MIGNEAVTLCRLDHACAAGELLVGESSLDIADFGRAAQSADNEGSEGVVVVEGDIGACSPPFPACPAFRRPSRVVENLFIKAAVERFNNGGDQACLRSKVVIGQPDRNLRPLGDGLHFQMAMALDELLLGRPDQSFSCCDRCGHARPKPELNSIQSRCEPRFKSKVSWRPWRVPVLAEGPNLTQRFARTLPEAKPERRPSRPVRRMPPGRMVSQTPLPHRLSPASLLTRQC